MVQFPPVFAAMKKPQQDERTIALVDKMIEKANKQIPHSASVAVYRETPDEIWDVFLKYTTIIVRNGKSLSVKQRLSVYTRTYKKHGPPSDLKSTLVTESDWLCSPQGEIHADLVDFQPNKLCAEPTAPALHVLFSAILLAELCPDLSTRRARFVSLQEDIQDWEKRKVLTSGQAHAALTALPNL